MAIRKRGNRYQVSYRCPGETSPRTETFKSEDEAIIRDKQIKLAKKNGTFEPPVKIKKGTVREAKQEITVSDFLDEYVENYGLKKWGNSYYSMSLGLIKNYIKPYIGDRYVRSLTVRDMDTYYTMLLIDRQLWCLVIWIQEQKLQPIPLVAYISCSKVLLERLWYGSIHRLILR